MRYAMLDFNGKPVRFFDYPHIGAVKLGYDYFMDVCGECLL